MTNSIPKRNPINTIILVFATIIAVSSGTFIYDNGIRYFLLFFMLLFLLVPTNKNKVSYKKNTMILFYTLFSIHTMISVIYSVDKINTLKYSFIYLSCLVFANKSFDENQYGKLFKYIEFFIIIFACSILISAIFKDLMPQLYFLTSKTAEEIERDISTGAFAGLAGDRAEAALLMLVGISLCWGQFCSKTKKTSIIVLKMILVYLALFLTSKRTLFVCSLIIPVLALLLFSKGKRKVTLIILVIIGAIVFGYLMNNVPVFQNIIVRLNKIDDLETMNGRSKLWTVSLNMLKTKPIFGYGFNTFNKVANEWGVRYGGSLGAEWIYQGHNSYLQILGELGVIGFMLYLGIFISFFYQVFKIHKRKEELTKNQQEGLLFCTFLMIVLLIYSITGNCAYYLNQIFIQAILIGYISTLYKSIKRKGNDQDENQGGNTYIS
ncbi:MAG: O-antigen ligase family protein [Clostridia bacterium]|nr:O-antigen ligase family protein [Clostridia bacterium]